MKAFSVVTWVKHRTLLYGVGIIVLIFFLNIGNLSAQSDDHIQVDALVYPIWSNNVEYPVLSTVITAESYLLLEGANNQVLLKKNHRQVRSIASLTKLMTAVIVLESSKQHAFSLDMQYPVMSAESFASLPYDASRMGLVVGDTPSGKELLNGLLVVSGNDAALYLAHIVAGSVEKFVLAMNAKAKALGLHNTYYDDPTGLSEKNRSTAEDIALLSQYILSHSEFDIVSYTSQSTFFWKQDRKSTNRLLETHTYVDGLKTGYTGAAGFNLITSAEKEKRRVLAIVLGIQAESISKGIQLRSQESIALIDFAYAVFSLIQFPAIEESVPVWGAKKNTVEMRADATILSVPALWVNTIQKRIQYHSDAQHIFAPIEKNTALASVVYSVHNKERSINIMEKELYTESAVEKANILKVLWHRFLVLFK